MAKRKLTLSRDEEIQAQWIEYFENIEKEKALILVLLKYFKDFEREIYKTEQRAKNQSENNEYENYKSEQKQSEFKSILPKYIEFINKKELRKILYDVKKKVDEFKINLEEKKLFASSELKEKINHFNELYDSYDKLKKDKIKPDLKNKITSLCIENFKGFAEKKEDDNDKENKNGNFIKIKPITLIFGPNSYGKSSIIQTLLLLSQTVREGEDYNNINLLPIGNLVQLGTFEDFINNQDSEKELKIEISINPDNYIVEDNNIIQNTSLLTEFSFCYYFKLIKNKKKKEEQIILSQIDIFGKQVDYTDIKNPITIAKKKLYTFEYIQEKQEKNMYKLTKHVDNSDVAEKIIFSSDIVKKDYLKKTSFFTIEDLTLLKKIENIIKDIVYLSSYRKPPERYYVPENNTRIYVGKNGEYTAEILSYDREVDNDVNYWLKELAGYSLSFLDKDSVSKKEQEQISESSKNKKIDAIKLNDKTTNLNNINLMDLGSGVAQVLPIITQAFKSQNSIILIEEPETHLHPKAQAKLGEMFAKSAEKTGNTFIIETHSENLLLRLERLIRKGQLSKDDVSVNYVHKDEKGSHCIPLEINERGHIEDIKKVPDGFFDEGFNELFDIGFDKE